MSLDERALAVEFRPRVLYFALRRLRNRDLAEEVAQQTVLILIEALREGRVEDEDRIGSFIFGIANNLILKQIEESSRQQASAEIDSVVDQVAWKDDPEAAVLLKEKRLQLQRAIAELTDAERDLLIETSREHGSGVAFAEKLGVSAASVRKRKSRIIARLRESLKDVTNRENPTLT